MGVWQRTLPSTSWSDESGRGLAALHDLAETRGTLEQRASVMECGQSSAAFEQVRRSLIERNQHASKRHAAVSIFSCVSLRPQ